MTVMWEWSRTKEGGSERERLKEMGMASGKDKNKIMGKGNTMLGQH